MCIQCHLDHHNPFATVVVPMHQWAKWTASEIKFGSSWCLTIFRKKPNVKYIDTYVHAYITLNNILHNNPLPHADLLVWVYKCWKSVYWNIQNALKSNYIIHAYVHMFIFHKTNNWSCFKSTEIDMCKTEISRCQHLCVKTNGSFYCECLTGYQLLSDNMTCKG